MALECFVGKLLEGYRIGMAEGTFIGIANEAIRGGGILQLLRDGLNSGCLNSQHLNG